MSSRSTRKPNDRQSGGGMSAGGKKNSAHSGLSRGGLHRSYGGGMFLSRLRDEPRKGWFRLPKERERPGGFAGSTHRRRMFDYIAAGGIRSLGARPIEMSVARRRMGMMIFCVLLAGVWFLFRRIPPPG